MEPTRFWAFGLCFFASHPKRANWGSVYVGFLIPGICFFSKKKPHRDSPRAHVSKPDREQCMIQFADEGGGEGKF